MHEAKCPQASEKFAFVAELYGLYPSLISSQTFCVGPSQMMCCKSVIEILLLPHFLQVFLVQSLYVITAGHFSYSFGVRYTLEADVYSDCLAAEGVLLEPGEQD